MEKEEKLDWIYKGANSLVDREEYLLGRKVDKTLEQINQEEKEKKLALPTPKNHVEHECIPPSIRDFNKIVHTEQVDLSAKLQEDPLVAIKKREEEARRQFLQNPVQLKKLQEALRSQQEKEKKHKKSKTKHSDDKLDEKIKKKLKLFKNSSLSSSKKGKKQTKGALDTILMHKFNALKEKISEDDLKDILSGNISDSSDEDKPQKKNKKKESESDRKQTKGNKRRGFFLSEAEIKEKKFSEERESKNRNKSRERKKEERRYQKGSSSESDSANEDQRSRKGYEIEFQKNRTDQHEKGRNKKIPQRNKIKCSGKDQDESKRKSTSNSGEKQKFEREHILEHQKIRNRSGSQDRNKAEKRKLNCSSEDESDEKHHRIKGQTEIKHGPKEKNSNIDLDEKIMAKLRMLRDEAESKKLKKPFFPERPPHLRKRSKSSNSCSSDGDVSTLRQDSDEEKHKPKAFGLVTSFGKKIDLKRTEEIIRQEVKPSKIREVHTKLERKQVKLTDEEKEKLRQEMIRDALVRDREREEYVARYREKDKKEEDMVNKSYDPDLVHHKLLKSAKHYSVEERIKSNLNNIQRSARNMDSNFSKR